MLLETALRIARSADVEPSARFVGDAVDMLAHQIPRMISLGAMSRTKTYLLRMSDQEHARLQKCAQRAGMSMNDFLLQKALGVMPVTPGAYHALETRVGDVEQKLAGLDQAVAKARKMLGAQPKE